VVARSVSIVRGADLGVSARHGLGTFESVLRARGWDVDEVPSAQSARGGVVVIASLAAAAGAWSDAAKWTQPPQVPEALAVKKGVSADVRTAALRPAAFELPSVHRRRGRGADKRKIRQER
jgi:hypothetical protein